MKTEDRNKDYYCEASVYTTKVAWKVLGRLASTRTLPAMRQGDCDAPGCFSNSPRPRRVRTLRRYPQHSVSAVGGACERGASALACHSKEGILTPSPRVGPARD